MFVGPNQYFKIVIDSFDGSTIKAWHFEDPKGNKTGNLALQNKGKHVDLLVTNANRTVSHFTTRYASRIYAEWDKLREAAGQ
ncbi:MAG: transcription factor [Chloroflexi bacterium]|nr:transcription factor [Chloroflexota bacterium]